MKKQILSIVKICFLVMVILVVVVLYFDFSFGKSNRVEVTLERCVDGDTALFSLNHKQVRVRFLAIDTPESVHPEREVEEYSMDASEYTCNKLKSANHIYLEYDNNSDKYDKYHRLLAWVFIDDYNLNELLVRNGYAIVKYVYGDYIYLDELCKSQEKAFQEKIGIWNNFKEEYVNNYCK